MVNSLRKVDFSHPTGHDTWKKIRPPPRENPGCAPGYWGNQARTRGPGSWDLKYTPTKTQWRRQWLMVSEAHLVGEANIFNVKYVIHECGLPTICRPPPGRDLLGRYRYLHRFATFFFRTSPSSLRNVRREKENVEQIYLPNNSIIFLPDSSSNKSPTRPLQNTSIRIPSSSCTNTACSCEGIGVGDVAQSYENVAALVFPRPPHAAAWVFSGTEAPG